MTCKAKQENNGVCPHHNLQCGWPKCNEPEQPAQQFTEDAPADCKRLAEHGAPICGRCHMGPCKYTAPQAQPAREPLTDEQWQIIADTLGCIITREQKDAIEAAHGIKENT